MSLDVAESLDRVIFGLRLSLFVPGVVVMFMNHDVLPYWGLVDAVISVLYTPTGGVWVISRTWSINAGISD